MKSKPIIISSFVTHLTSFPLVLFFSVSPSLSPSLSLSVSLPLPPSPSLSPSPPLSLSLSLYLSLSKKKNNNRKPEEETQTNPLKALFKALSPHTGSLITEIRALYTSSLKYRYSAFLCTRHRHPSIDRLQPGNICSDLCYPGPRQALPPLSQCCSLVFPVVSD